MSERILLLLALCNLALLSCTGAHAEPPHDVVQTKRLELVDDSGTVRAQLFVESSGEVVFRLRDQTGAIRVKLGADVTGSGLLLNNDGTEPGFHALAKDTGTSLRLRNKDGREQLLQP